MPGVKPVWARLGEKFVKVKSYDVASTADSKAIGANELVDPTSPKRATPAKKLRGIGDPRAHLRGHNRPGSARRPRSQRRRRAEKEISDEPELPPIPGLIKPGSKSIRAIAVPRGLQKEPLIVGTAKCDLHMINDDKMTSAVRGHSGVLRGLAQHPTNKFVFASTGSDKRLSFYHCGRKEVLVTRYMKHGSRTCAFSNPNSTYNEPVHIAVGFVNGAFAVFDLATLQQVAYHPRPRGKGAGMLHGGTPISDIRYSSNSGQLAVAAHDNHIDLWYTGLAPKGGDDDGGAAEEAKAEEPAEAEPATAEAGDKAVLSGRTEPTITKYKHFRRLKGHSSFVTHIDWSMCGTYMQSNCASYEHLFWDCKKGRQVRSTTDTIEADTDWHTMTCVLGFPVMGIWPDDSNGTDVNSLHMTRDERYVVTCDDFGNVKLFNAPCVVEDAPYLRNRGHSSHVMNIRFTTMEEYVVSAGGMDHALFQWKVVYPPGFKSALEEAEAGLGATAATTRDLSKTI